MFARSTTDRTPRPNSLIEFGMTSGSYQTVSLNEVTYKRGIEIYGEQEPADYIYQVRTGAIEPTSCSRMVGARSAHFTWSATFLGLKTVASIDLPRKLLRRLPFV